MKKFLLLSLLFGLVSVAQAEEYQAIKEALSKVVQPGVTASSIKPVGKSGLYEVIYEGQVIYVTKDGRYLLQGDLFDIDQRKNITEETRSVSRLKLVESLDEKDMIVFSPKKVKHTVTIFTDIDCGYCRKLHKEMDDYLDLGIKVRYLSYPRAGVDSPSYEKSVSVWCAKDRNAAMTAAKLGEKVEKKECKNPVKDHMEAAKQVGVSGTPTIVLDNGTVIPGYVPADRLLQALSNN